MHVPWQKQHASSDGGLCQIEDTLNQSGITGMQFDRLMKVIYNFIQSFETLPMVQQNPLMTASQLC